MCRLILLVILLWLVGLTIAVTVAAIYGPIWSIPLVVIGYLLLSAILLKVAFKQLLLIPFRLKGRVLRGATMQLHGIERGVRPRRGMDPSPAPSLPDAAGGENSPTVEVRRRDPAAEPPDNREYYWVDMTIKPIADPNGAFKLWEPSELALMPAGARISIKDDVEEAAVHEVQVWTDGTWAKDDACKYPGMQRVRLLFGVKPGFTRHVKVRYYLESFGDLQLPSGPTPQPAPAA